MLKLNIFYSITQTPKRKEEKEEKKKRAKKRIRTDSSLTSTSGEIRTYAHAVGTSARRRFVSGVI